MYQGCAVSRKGICRHFFKVTFLQFLPVTTAGHEPDLAFEPLFCHSSVVLQLMLFWLRHTEAWISETFKGLSQMNLFHLLAHPHPDLSHHVYFYPRCQPSTHSALQFTYSLYSVLFTLAIVPISPPSQVQFAHFPLLMIFHTHVRSLSLAPQEHWRCVIYMCEGNRLTGGNNGPFQGSIFAVPRGTGGRELSTAG